MSINGAVLCHNCSLCAFKMDAMVASSVKLVCPLLPGARVDSSDMMDVGCVHTKFATPVVPIPLVSDTGV